MPPALKDFLKRWLFGTVAVLVAAVLIKGIAYDDWQHLLVATFLLGILNSLLRPVKIIFGLFTLGLFTWFINALLLLFVAQLVPSFQVDDFGDALLGALVISIISISLNQLTGTGGPRIQVRRGKRPPPTDRNHHNDGGGSGPIIDV